MTAYDMRISDWSSDVCASDLAEASRIMYADRDRYVGDPRFVPVPVQGLLDPAYVDARRKLIGATAAVPAPSAGHPQGAPRSAERRVGNECVTQCRSRG